MLVSIVSIIFCYIILVNVQPFKTCFKLIMFKIKPNKQTQRNHTIENFEHNTIEWIQSIKIERSHRRNVPIWMLN